MTDLDDLKDKMDELSIKMEGLAPKPTIRNTPFLGHRDSRTVSSFIGEFNKLATAYNWTEKEMCRTLPIYLSKEAQIIYDGLTKQQKESWPVLIDQLAKKFAIGAGVTHYRRMCQTRKQRPGESIPIFAETIGQLVDKGYPDGGGFNSQIRKELAIDLYRNGLKISLRESLRHKTKPQSLHEAIQEAIEEEEAQAELAREKLANSQVEAVNQLIPQQNTSQNFGMSRPAWNQNRGRNFRTPFREFSRREINWNQRPFPRQYNRNGPYYNRNRFEQNRDRGNANFVPIGNRFQRRGRGRGGYKINTVRARETAPNSPTPFWSIVTVATLIAFSTLETSSAYQICSDRGEKIFVAPPEKANCSAPEGHSVVGEFQIEIFVPRTRPLIFQGFSCQKKIIGASTYSFLKMFNSRMIFPDTLESIPPEDCWKLAKEGKLGKKELVRVDENTLRSYTELKLSWGILGSEYFYEYDFVVSIGMVYVSYDNKIVKSELGFFAKCSFEERVCEEENATLIWDDPADFHCPYESAGTYKGTISESYVIVENLQAAFIFSDKSDGNITDAKTTGCFRANTFSMENDVFISIPGMDRFLTNRKTKKLRIPLRFDIDYDYEEGEARAQRNARELKRPRKMGSNENFRPTQKNAITPSVPTTISTKMAVTQPSTHKVTSTVRTTFKTIPLRTTTQKITLLATPFKTTQKPTEISTPRTIPTTRKIITQEVRVNSGRINWPRTTQKIPTVGTTTPISTTTTLSTTTTPISTTTTQISTTTTQISTTTTPIKTTITPIKTTTTKNVQVTQRTYLMTRKYFSPQIPPNIGKTDTPKGAPDPINLLQRQSVSTSKRPEIMTIRENTKSYVPITQKSSSPKPVTTVKHEETVNYPTTTKPEHQSKKGMDPRELSRAKKYEREAKNMVEKIANIFGIKMRRDITRNTNFTTPLGTKDKQTDNSVNVKLQYLETHTKTTVQRNFDRLWSLICDLHNRQIDTVKSILAMNPTLGTRLWLRKHEISAKFVGEAILVTKCHQLVPKKIYWNHEVNGTCYEKVPVEISENKELFFLVSGSQAQDLEPVSKNIPCSERPISVFKDQQGIWQTYEGPTSVENFPNSLPYKPEKAKAIFKAETIFQSDLNSVMASVSILHGYANRINTKEKVIREQNVTMEGNSNILTEVSKIAREKAQNITENVTTLLNNPFTFFFGDMKFYAIIIAVGISTFGLIFAGFYFYPWIEPFLRIRSKRKQMAPKRRAPDPPISEWDRESPPKRKRRAPEPPRGDLAGINQLMSTEPSAPEESELGTFVHTLIPKIYQISQYGEEQKAQPFLSVKMNGVHFKALLDTGASVSYCRIGVAKSVANIQFELGPITHAKVANGNSFPFLAEINVTIGIQNVIVPMTILVSEDKHCPTEMILGTDFMKTLSDHGYEIAFDWQSKSIKLSQFRGTFQTSVPMIAIVEIAKENKLKLKEKSILEPHTDNFLPAESLEGLDQEFVFTSQGNYELKDCVMIGKTVCKAKSPFVRILNVGNQKVTLYPGQTVAKWESMDEETKCETVFGINSNAADTIESPELDITANFPEIPSEPELLANLNLNESCLSECAKIELRKIILKHQDAFVGAEGNIGHFSGPLKHRIDLIDEKKIVQQRPYRVPPQLREEVHKQIHELLRQNIIRESNSVFSSPIVLVKKKDGKYRFAIDYRLLNQNTKKSCYFLPLIQDILDEIGGKTIFSSFDFMSGFFQIGVEESHIERTAFATFCGVFEFLRMPMGLCGAPCTFQKVMESLRKELGNGILCYLDDLIIASIDEGTHLRDLENLLGVLKKYNLKLRLDKCVFGRSEIKYLGFLISAQGIRPDPKNVAAVQRFDPPKTLHQLRSFIGCVSYFRRFIKNFASIIAPLNELTKSEKTIEKVWNDEHQKAFDHIKKKLLSAPVLAPPKFNRPFIIETDASKVAIAACLLQKGEDGEHPISYISRKLNSAEQRYITAEIEGLAIIYALKQFRPYIEGTETTIVRTDNSVACSLLKKRDLVGRMAKYQIAVQEHNIKIEHRSGKSNKFCDYMSRYPGGDETDAQCAAVEIDWDRIGSEMAKANEEIRDFELPKELYYPTEKLKIVTLDEIREELLKDTEYKKILEALKRENIPDEEREQEKFFREVESIHASFSLIDEVLYRWVEIDQNRYVALVIPHALRERIIRECHEDELLGAHLGIVKTIEKMRKRFWWKNLVRDVKRQLNACGKCQQRKSHPKDVFKEPLNPIPVPKMSLERVHIDILGPLPITTEGFKYILTITDSFSKWLTAVPMVDQTAKTVTKSFVDNFLSKFGTPKSLVSDNGRQFVGKIFEDLAKIYSFKHHRTTTYRPQSNGAVERMNRVVADMLFNYVNSKGDNWADFLQLVTFAYNTSSHSTTGKSPFFLLFWREPTLPIDLRLEREGRQENERDVNLTEYVEAYANELKDIAERVRETMLRAQERQKEFADAGRNAREHKFFVGELVMVLIDHWQPDEYHKFRPKWSGPWKVTEIKGPILTVKKLGTPEKIVKVNKEKVKGFIQNFERQNEGNTGDATEERVEGQ